MTEIAPILKGDKAVRTADFAVPESKSDGFPIANLAFNQLVDLKQKPSPVILSQTALNSFEKQTDATAELPVADQNSPPDIAVDLIELETALVKSEPDQPLPKVVVDPPIDSAKAPAPLVAQNPTVFQSQPASTNQDFAASQNLGANSPPTGDVKQPPLRGSESSPQTSPQSQVTPTATTFPDSVGKTNATEKSVASPVNPETGPPAVAKTSAPTSQPIDIAPDLSAKKQAVPSTPSSSAPLHAAPAISPAVKGVQRDTDAAIRVKPATPEVSSQKNDSSRDAAPRHSTTPAAQITSNPGTIVTPAIRMAPNMALLDSDSRPAEVRNTIEFMTAAETSLRQATTSYGPQPQPAQTHASQDARHIAQQLAAKLTKQSDGTTVIRLNPDELGPVRMSLRNTDGVMALTILAERPETAEIMRRNIGELAQEFNALGYTNLSFDFGDGGAAADDFGGAAPTKNESSAILPESDLPATQNVNATRDARLDIRL